jgi:hypothetical protein
MRVSGPDERHKPGHHITQMHDTAQRCGRRLTIVRAAKPSRVTESSGQPPLKPIVSSLGSAEAEYILFNTA